MISKLKDIRDRYVERRREVACREKLEAWKQKEFTERMSELLDEFRNVDPEAQLVFAGANRALIIARHPETGLEQRFPFVL